MSKRTGFVGGIWKKTMEIGVGLQSKYLTFLSLLSLEYMGEMVMLSRRLLCSFFQEQTANYTNGDMCMLECVGANEVEAV